MSRRDFAMKRKTDEDYADYVKRRKRIQTLLRQYCAGRVFWDSLTKGTYRKPKPEFASKDVVNDKV